MTIPTSGEPDDRDLECDEPHNGLFLVVVSKSGCERGAYQQALDIIIRTGCPVAGIVSNRSNTAWAIPVPSDLERRLEFGFRRIRYNLFSAVLVSRRRILSPADLSNECLVHASVHVRDENKNFDRVIPRRRRKLRVEVFSDCAFVCTEAWVLGG